MAIEVKFEGKFALNIGAYIAGAYSVLGSRFAKILAEAGAQVMREVRRTERLKKLSAAINSNSGILMKVGCISLYHPHSL